MNAQKFTQKSLEAVQRAQELTLSHENQQMEQVHLLRALLEQGLIPQLLQKMNTDVDALSGRWDRDRTVCLASAVRPGRLTASMCRRRWTASSPGRRKPPGQ